MATEHGPSGPLSPPASTTWRRQRLSRLRSTTATPSVSTTGAQSSPETPTRSLSVRSKRSTPQLQANESTLLQDTHHHNNYGTVRTALPRIGRRARMDSSTSKHDACNDCATHPSELSDSSYFKINKQRPISAYDAPLNGVASEEVGIDAKVNGVRVWYSSFASIDWIHDSIKDHVRYSRLHRRRSLRGRMLAALDQATGWIIVTIVGFLTAILAFLVIRSEQWFFSFKEGYCKTGWWKSLQFCCSATDASRSLHSTVFTTTEYCDAWMPWGDTVTGNGTLVQSEFLSWVVYAVIAIFLAVSASVLTIYLTASTSFVTRKDSGVLAPSYVEICNGKAPVRAVADAPKRKVMYYAAGSGIPEIKTILSGFVIHGYLGGRTLFVKALGLSLAVGSGLSLGKEGPFVHISSCVGNIVSRFIEKYENNEAKRREILSAACAAGVAVAFGAPIGGTLFSLEEVSYFFPAKVMWRSFFCAMIAAITLKFLDPFGTGKLVLFQVTYDRDWHAYELFPFLVLGVFGGVYGAYFSKMNYLWTRHVRNGTRLKSHPIVEVVLVTLATSILCFLNPFTRMGGTELIYELFLECKPGTAIHSGLCVANPGSWAHVLPVVQALALALLVRGALTVVTFGIRLPSGIFIPMLAVGACAGRLVGLGVQWLQWNYPENAVFAVCAGDMECVVPGLYAMVGAAAVMSGVTRTTVSLAVIMFELTDTLTYAVPVMLAVLVAKTVADALEPKGIYDLVIDLAQLPYLDAKTTYLWGSLTILDAADRDVEVIRLDRENTVSSLRDQLEALLNAGYDDSGFPILRTDGDADRMRMVGYIGANELEHALSIVAHQPDATVQFHTAYSQGSVMASSIPSLLEDNARAAVDPFDFSVYMDQAPLTIQSNSPLELLRQLFVKLGARYVVVTDVDGLYEGVIDKKTWLAFLRELEEKS